MSESNTFGARLRDLRVKSGLSQEEAAARLGVSPQSVSKWETEKCYPEFLLIMPLARLYGVSADELLGKEDRRAWWEEKWQEALREGGETATLPVTEEALKELPGDWQFRYRQGCAEFFMFLEAEMEQDKQRWLAAAEKHLRALHEDEPMNESAGSMLVTVLMTQGRLQEAEEICRKLPNGERELLHVLRGEKQKKQLRRVTTASFRTLLSDLISCGAERSLISGGVPEALEAAERIITEVLGAEGFFADLLISVHWKRAESALEAGDGEKAMAELTAIRDLTARWAGAGGYEKAPEKAPFLEPHSPLRQEEHLWDSFVSLLRSPFLTPLRDRADFRALLAEAERGSDSDRGVLR
jgi:transcriptional regulator with XRE-family HTH domain